MSVVDHLSREGRSRNMAAIRSRNTRPERALRAALRELGATGYRLHVKSLPGTPDVTFSRWRIAVFVDGAFWHGHPDHFDPSTATEYWRTKMARNEKRDRVADEALRAMGWRVSRFWDFEVKESVERCAQLVVGLMHEAGWRGSTGEAGEAILEGHQAS